MFGYLGSKLVVESAFWTYGSVKIFREVGSKIETVRAKIFENHLIDVLNKIEIGAQVQFDVKFVKRESRTYRNITDLKEASFDSCGICGQAVQECNPCPGVEAERLEGVFTILDITGMEYGFKIILRKGDVTLTYLLWASLPFFESANLLNIGDCVNVIGWRSSERITTMRVFEKVPPVIHSDQLL